MLAEAAREGHVVLHVAVATAFVNRDLDVTREGRRGAAPPDDGSHTRELLVVESTHREMRSCTLGDDVRCLAALHDVAVHAHAVPHVHALTVDEPESLHARGERAHSVPRSECRVRRFALESEVEVSAGQCDVSQEIAIEGVKHHRRVDAAKHARLEQSDLASSAFLGGRSNELDRALELAA